MRSLLFALLACMAVPAHSTPIRFDLFGEVTEALGSQFPITAGDTIHGWYELDFSSAYDPVGDGVYLVNLVNYSMHVGSVGVFNSLETVSSFHGDVLRVDDWMPAVVGQTFWMLDEARFTFDGSIGEVILIGGGYTDARITGSLTAVQVPEPGTLPLIGLGILGVAIMRRRMAQNG